MSTLTDERERHATAAHDVVITLMGVKSWSRLVHQWADSERSNSALLTLSMIERTAPTRARSLAELAQVDVSVVSRHVAHLEKCGLVERHPDPDDGRAQLLTLTAAGRQVVDDGRAKLTEMVSERLSGWDAAELEEVSDRLRRLLADLTAA